MCVTAVVVCGQAQARCHRIGQSKAVKVYRLITRNSYEREMFDKASLKLGLDKAVLQSMGGEKNVAPVSSIQFKSVCFNPRRSAIKLKAGVFNIVTSDLGGHLVHQKSVAGTGLKRVRSSLTP
jgi:hypothetical protein